MTPPPCSPPFFLVGSRQPLSHHPGGVAWTQSAGAPEQPFRDMDSMRGQSSRRKQQALGACLWHQYRKVPCPGSRRMLLDAQGRTARVPTLASATPSQRGLLAPGLLLSKCWHLKSKFSHLGNALHLLKVTHVLMRSQDFAVPTDA